MMPSATAPWERPGAKRRLENAPSGTHWLLLPFLLTALFFAGCARPGPRADLIIINGAEPESLDPGILTGEADGRIALELFAGLMRYEPTNAMPVPDLAEGWDLSADRKVYTFHLRPHLAWSTGGPITAQDVVYSWLRVLAPRTAAEYAGQLFYLKNGEEFNTGRINDPAQVGVQAMNARTLRVELKNPTPFFLNLCALPTLRVVPRQAIEKHGDRWLMTRPVPCSGPYELAAWRINDRIRLRKNPRYWDAANTRCEVVDMLPGTSANTALNLYETGEADIVWDKNLVPVELLDVLLKRPDFHSYSYLGTYFIRFNVTRKPFDDPRVRKALTLAIDRTRIVERITRGGEHIASSQTPRGIPGYEPPEGLGHDPAEARRLLAEAGFPGGRAFPSFDYLCDNTSHLHEQIAVELQAMWQRELGIHAEIRKLEWKTYLRAQGGLDYDLCRSSWIGDYNDPNTFLDMFMSNNGNNRTGWKSAYYDELVNQANAQADRAKRAEMLRSAETLLVRDAVPVAPLFFYAGLDYYDADRIKGIFPNLLSVNPVRAIYKVGAESVLKSTPQRAAMNLLPATQIAVH